MLSHSTPVTSRSSDAVPSSNAPSAFIPHARTSGTSTAQLSRTQGQHSDQQWSFQLQLPYGYSRPEHLTGLKVSLGFYFASGVSLSTAHDQSVTLKKVRIRVFDPRNLLLKGRLDWAREAAEYERTVLEAVHRPARNSTQSGYPNIVNVWFTSESVSGIIGSPDHQSNTGQSPVFLPYNTYLAGIGEPGADPMSLSKWVTFWSQAIGDKKLAKKEEGEVIIAQIVDSLLWLHSQKVSHENLNAETVLLYKAGALLRIQISDFAFASSPVLAAPSYMPQRRNLLECTAPEMLELPRHVAKGPKGDLYALGVLMAEVMAQRKGFGDSLRGDGSIPACQHRASSFRSDIFHWLDGSSQLSGKGLVRSFGGLASALFRLGSYLFLRWIPGRFATIPVPLFYALACLAHYFNNQYITPSATAVPSSSNSEPPTDEDSAVVLSTPRDAKPSYATVAAAHTESEKAGDAQLLQATGVTPTNNALTPSQVRKLRRKKSAALNNAARAENNAVVADSESDDEEKPNAKTAGLSLSGLLFGAPSTSPIINAFSLVTNTVLLLAVLDSLWSPALGMDELDLTFSRVGAVNHHSAKIVARIPPDNFTGATAIAVNTTDGLLADEKEGRGARVAYRPTKPVLGKWVMGPLIPVEEENDWTGVVTLESLYANTEYEYRLLLPSLTHSHHPAFPSTHQFTTFPDPDLTSPASPGAGTHFTFAASSCVKPGFPYNGPWSKRDVPGAKWLLDVVEEQKLKFVMFLGDFIYVDTPRYGGPYVAEYYKKYRQILASPQMKALIEKVPFMTIWDDHEIYNDYSASTPSERYVPAAKAYVDYLGFGNPTPSEYGQHYYDFRHGDAAFFVLDARTYRSANAAVDDEMKTMLGARQKEVFTNWLAKVNQTVTFKFVVTSTPFMTLWGLSDDTWAGFQTERSELLDLMEYVPNVIVLSGDRHEFAAASIRTTVTEFSTSPLSQFYLPVRTLSQNNGLGATGEDILLKYLPDGNSKFSTFEVDTRIANKPVVRVKVIIDGQEAWAVEVQGKQLALPPPTTTVGSLGKSLAELLGFKRRSWF